MTDLCKIWHTIDKKPNSAYACPTDIQPTEGHIMSDDNVERIGDFLVRNIAELGEDAFTEACFTNEVFDIARFNCAINRLSKLGKYDILTQLIQSLKNLYPETFASCLKKE